MQFMPIMGSRCSVYLQWIYSTHEDVEMLLVGEEEAREKVAVKAISISRKWIYFRQRLQLWQN